MDAKQETFSIPCHNFSDIRRRPLVIGKLDQVRLPFVVTMPQLAVGALTLAVLFLARPAWGAVLNDRLHIVVFTVTPVLVAQQVSRTSIEGRSVSKAALGMIRLWTAPRSGTINGRRRKPSRTDTLVVRPLLVQPPRTRKRDRRPRARRTHHHRGPGGRGRRSANRSSGKRQRRWPWRKPVAATFPAPAGNSVSDERQRGAA